MDDDNPATPWLPTLGRFMRPGELADFLTLAGLGPEDAAKWADSYIGPNETARAVREGRTIEEFLELRRERLGRRPAVDAEVGWRENWKREGFDERTAAPWRERGVSAKAARRWREAGFGPAEVSAWTSPDLRQYRFSLDEAVRWRSAGFGPDDARVLKDLNYSAHDMGRFVDLHNYPQPEREALVLWGQVGRFIVVATADAVLDAISRRQAWAIIDAATHWEHLQRRLPRPSIERELGNELDELWMQRWMPKPDEDSCPTRDPEWFPAGALWLSKAWWSDKHPFDALDAVGLDFDVAAARSGDTPRYRCLWHSAQEMLVLSGIATAAGFALHRDDAMLNLLLRGVT